MLGGDAPAVRGLRPGDPQQLGAYRIVGRLGEGGMGSVFLAETADGTNVALKVIRSGLAGDPEFRRRFRSEVARARQVPPFCTAEVLDADTEHDPPYLVVEYVDGPSLAAVVEQRGPLTPANQHGIAVGVAVALTAIHGAGVIHRDLKPANVLLAPGSPKVIDFGIARAAQPDSENHTRTDQVVGTVSYMAPERFGPNPGQTLTPAADIFAWGAVVAFAATGRTPFAADTPAAAAIRIMTQPPDLDGLTGPLRQLVERALAKDPAQRPTARELVDHLLAGGATQPRPAAFAEQPEVLAAAGISSTITQDLGPRTKTMAPTSHPQQSYRPPPRPYPQAPPPLPAAPRRRGRAALVVGLSLFVVLLAGTAVAYATGKLSLPGGGNATATSPPAGGPTTVPAGTDPASSAAAVPGLVQRALDTFTGATAFVTRNDPANGALCEVTGHLRVVLTRENTYRCLGLQTQWTNMVVRVSLTLTNPASCAGIWFRYTNETGGYALRVCEDGLHVVTHAGSTVRQLAFFPAAIALGRELSVTITALGDKLSFERDGVRAGDLVDGSLPNAGRVVLGVFQVAHGAAAPFEVSFARLEVLTPA